MRSTATSEEHSLCATSVCELWDLLRSSYGSHLEQTTYYCTINSRTNTFSFRPFLPSREDLYCAVGETGFRTAAWRSVPLILEFELTVMFWLDYAERLQTAFSKIGLESADCDSFRVL